MKPTTNLCGILAVLCFSTALGQDKKVNLSATGRPEAAQQLNGDVLSAATREKLIKAVLPPKSPDIIVGRRLVMSGPLVTLIRSEDRLHAFNPFAASNADGDARWESRHSDPYLPPPRGITLFRMSF